MSSPSRILLVLCCAICSLTASAASASAAPANDDFANPLTVTPLAPAVGNNINAANDPPEAAKLQSVVGWAFHGAVWNEYTAAQKGDVTFTICADFPTNNLVVEGDSLAEITLAQNLGGSSAWQGLSLGGEPRCAPTDYGAHLGPFPVEPGDKLRPVVSGAYSSPQGWYAVNTSFTPSPENDNFADAKPIRSRTAQSSSTTAASLEPDEENNPFTNHRSVWFDFEAIGSGGADIEVCADFPVNVVAYSGTQLDDLTPLNYGQSASPGSCAGGRYGVVLSGVATSDFHVSYESLKIQIGGHSSPTHQGNFDIEVRQNGAPANDTLFGSFIMEPGGASAVEYGDNTLATINADSVDDSAFEPAGRFLDQGKTIFFHYRTYSPGEYTFDTCSSSVDTVVQVFSVNTLQPLSADAYGDDGCPSGGGTKLKSIWAGASDGGLFRVGSKANGPGGPIIANVVWDPAPANNDFQQAASIWNGHTIAGSTKGANAEASEPDNAVTSSSHRSVWYRFEAPANGRFTFDTCDANFDSVVTAWTGSELSNLSQLGGGASANDGCDSGAGSKLANVLVRSGKTVFFQVDGATAGERGSFTASLSFAPGPENDDWADAIDLGADHSVSVDATNVNASGDYDLDTFTATGPMILAQYRSSSVWFKWTAPHSATYHVDTCEGSPNGYDGVMAVYRKDGDVPPFHNLLDHATDDDGCSGDRPSMPKLSFSANHGETYWIAVAAHTTGTDSGTNFRLKISTAPMPTSAPEITADDLFVGTELSTSNGGWSGTAPLSFQYRWLRCDSGGSGCTEIAGAEQSSYTLVAADVGHTIRSRVEAGNGFGGDNQESQQTGVVSADSDSDGVGDADDNCNFTQTGTVKSNGCVTEGVAVTTQPAIEGDRALESPDGLTIDPGTAANDPGDDSTVDAPEVDDIDWFRCESPTDELSCDSRTASGPSDRYVVEEDDLGGYMRARVLWTNSDNQSDDAWSEAVPLYKISIGPRPSLSGTPQVGQTLTGNVGAAENQPATAPGDTDPSVLATQWWFCSSQSDSDSCEMGPAGNTLVVPASAQGRYVRFGVIWTNGIHTRSEDSDASEQIAAAPVQPPTPPAPPATPEPFDLSSLKLPKKASFKGIVKAKGKFTIKSIVFACPTGGADCKIDLALTAKVKKKVKKLGSSSLVIPAGSTRPLSGKLSRSGLKLFKTNKKLKVTVAMKGSGGGRGKATFKEFTVTK